MGANETPVQVAQECSAVFRAHGRTLNRMAPNWTAHLDCLEWWLIHELTTDTLTFGGHASCRTGGE